jgi:hypothetical protein
LRQSRRLAPSWFDRLIMRLLSRLSLRRHCKKRRRPPLMVSPEPVEGRSMGFGAVPRYLRHAAWIYISANPLISLDCDRNFGPLTPRRFNLRDTCPIALAGTLVRTGDQGRAAVPGWWRDGAPLGDEPPSPGLDGDQRQRPCPPPGQEHWRGAGNRATLLNLRGLGLRPASRLLLPRQGAFFERPDCESRAWQR